MGLDEDLQLASQNVESQVEESSSKITVKDKFTQVNMDGVPEDIGSQTGVIGSSLTQITTTLDKISRSLDSLNRGLLEVSVILTDIHSVVVLERKYKDENQSSKRKQHEDSNEPLHKVKKPPSQNAKKTTPSKGKSKIKTPTYEESMEFVFNVSDDDEMKNAFIKTAGTSMNVIKTGTPNKVNNSFDTAIYANKYSKLGISEVGAAVNPSYKQPVKYYLCVFKGDTIEVWGDHCEEN